LSTTLERAGAACERMSFANYYRLTVGRVKPHVETLTGVMWDVPPYSSEIEKSFENDLGLLSLGRFPSIEFYRYMVYLRHHGFPSPLLDWSCSPNVAAFFAFREPVDTSKDRSIYVYCEMPRGTKGGAVGGPTIRPIGKYVRSHPRHFRQQSDYTICGSFERGVGWCFHSHHPVFGWHGQDCLWKLTLPSTERASVLRLLDDYNLNAFSLFDNEETLLETMWFREYVLK
jgi:FRG domain